MKTPQILFSILNTLILLIIITIVLGLLITILSVLGVMPETTLKDEFLSSETQWPHYLIMVLNLVVYVIFIYGLFKLRIVSKLFLKKSFYHSELGKNSYIAGICFILSGVFWWLFDGLSSIYLDNKISIGVSDKTFIYLFFIVIGLFFILTSKMFDSALELKSENDLTI